MSETVQYVVVDTSLEEALDPGWYFWEEEYPEEGSCGPYASRGEAIAAIDGFGHAYKVTPAPEQTPA